MDPGDHDDALKRVTMKRTTVDETEMVKGFHPEARALTRRM
jgi:hypothetical protein